MNRRRSSGRLVGAILALAAPALLPVLVPTLAPAAADTIELHARPVILSYDDLDADRVGALQFRGGLDLRSPDARFGGLSGLDISDDGSKLVAVGDRGIWFTARLVYGPDGRLADATDGEILPLRGLDGAPLTGKGTSDAESLARLTDGSYVVGFERDHRLRRYAAVGARAQRLTVPAVLATSPPNAGAEALARLWGESLLLLSEGLDARPGIAAGWIGAGKIGADGTDGGWRAVGFRRTGIFRPVGADTRDDGAVFVLERRFSTLGGVGTRISMVQPGRIAPGGIFEGRELAQLAPPLVADNFEGISVRRNGAGETLVYIVSDDNFNDLQRTFLLLFALAE